MRSAGGTRISQLTDISRATWWPDATRGYLVTYVGERLAQDGCAGRTGICCMTHSTEAVLDGEGGRLSARRNSQFGVEVLDVGLRGAGADEQPRGDLTVCQTVWQQPENLQLSWGDAMMLRYCHEPH